MKTDYCVIDFSASGEVSAMHRDEFPLGFLGRQTIARASEIMFDESTQLWDIWLIEGDPVPRLAAGARDFPTYDTARKAEVAWLEAARLNDVHPMSAQGLALLAAIRATEEVT